MASSGESADDSPDYCPEESGERVSPNTSSEYQETTTDKRRNTDQDEKDFQPTACKRMKIDDMKQLITDNELEHRVADIAKQKTLQLGNTLPDDQMRWLVIGICLHSIVTPALRQHVPPILQNLYTNLKTSNNIDTQTYPNHLQRYRPTNKELNYEAINNNNTIRKHRNGAHLRQFVYSVQSYVDLSKLFLLTHMAHYTGIDDTCDSSAVLGIIINISDKFDPALRAAAGTIRDDIRNPWAHCNFAEWDNQKFQNSFLLMEHMIQCLKLAQDKEKELVIKLKSWQLNGSHLMQGTIGFEILKDVKKETCDLAEYSKNITASCDENFQKVHSALQRVNLKFESIEQGVYNLKIENQRRKLEVKQVKEDLQSTNEQLECTTQTVKILSAKLDSNTERYHFNAPNRTAVFVGREPELEQLGEKFRANSERTYTQAICGLGGMGKTTLATEYSWRYQERYPGGIFWVLAESDDTLFDSFKSLAVHFRVEESDNKTAMRKTMRMISSMPGSLLLVADNLDCDKISKTMAEFLFGAWKRDTKMHMMITSRRESLNAMEAFRAESCIKMLNLTTAQGKDFMTKRTHGTGIAGNENTIEKIVEELGGLPLALEQAAAHIRVLNCSFDEYLQAFKEKRFKLLRAMNKADQFHESEERLNVQTTWNMNFDLIVDHSKETHLGTAAVTVMELIALAPGTNFYLSMLNTGFPDIKSIKGALKFSPELECLHEAMSVDLKRKEIIEILARFSIVDREQSDTVIMHRLVKQVIEDRMSFDKHKFIDECLVKMLTHFEQKIIEKAKGENRLSKRLILRSLLYELFIKKMKLNAGANIIKSWA